MTTIYLIQSDLASPEYHPTKEVAIREARASHANAPDQTIEVWACEVDTSRPIRELVCLLLTGTGWADEQTSILRLEAKR